MTKLSLSSVLVGITQVIRGSGLRLLFLTLLGGAGISAIGWVVVVALGIEYESLESEDPEEVLSALAAVLVCCFLAIPYGCGVIYSAYEGMHRRRVRGGALILASVVRTPRACLLTLALSAFFTTLIIVLSLVFDHSTSKDTMAVFYSAAFGSLLLLTRFSCVWFVVPAVCVIEKRSFSSLRRSSRLTKGNRTVLFLALLLFSGLFTLVDRVAGHLLLRFEDALLSLDVELSIYVIAYGLVNGSYLLGFLAFALLVPTVAYVRLREHREGGEADAISEVFH